jgi:nickel-dependent lactate racemase
MAESSPQPQSLVCAVGSKDTTLSDNDIKSHLLPFLESLGPREDVLILPPDYTRLPSQAGKITRFISEYYNFTTNAGASCDGPTSKKVKSNVSGRSESRPDITILPALGTHAPMTRQQIRSMFGDALAEKQPDPFVVHDWRNDVITIGTAPAEMVRSATNGMVEQEWPAQLNKLVWEKRHHDPSHQPHKSLVLSIGQVVPHEVMGMANFNKNLFVGAGGVEAINLSHFIGAVYGMEKMMGRSKNPLRSILNYASEQFLQKELDLWYILTVMGSNKESGELEMRGFYIGNDIDCYTLACELSLQINFTLLDRPLKKVVVFLDGDEFHSTWLGNKSIYRTRMAIADGGELIVIAPGVKEFGEDAEIDRLIRKYGYVGTPKVLAAMKGNPELEQNLSAVAHLIHGSSEGRFRVIYCPGHLSREEIESVGFQYGDLAEMTKRYDPNNLKDGWNQVSVAGIAAGSDVEESSEDIFYISNPALGLWALKSRFEEDGATSRFPPIPPDPISSLSTQNAADGSGGVGGWAKPSIENNK